MKDIIEDTRRDTLAWCLKVTRSDDTVYAWTSHDEDIDFEATTYLSAPGFDVKSFTNSAGLEVANNELTVLEDDAAFGRIPVLEGRWDGARYEIFQVDRTNPVSRINWPHGKLGNAQPRNGFFVVELRDLRQALQNDATRVTQANCDYRYGDANCTVDLAPVTFAMTVTAATDTRHFTDSSLAQAADYFAEGYVDWLTGLNAGLRSKVYAHEAGGVITLDIALLQEVQVGDTGTITQGCRKRRADCIARGNVLNFPGFDDTPTSDHLVSRADPEAVVEAPTGPEITPP